MRTVALLVFISTALAAGAWLLFLWAVKSDQYDDVEGPKHRMMDDDGRGASPPPRRDASPSRKQDGAAGQTPAAPPKTSPKDRVRAP